MLRKVCGARDRESIAKVRQRFTTAYKRRAVVAGAIARRERLLRTCSGRALGACMAGARGRIQDKHGGRCSGRPRTSTSDSRWRAGAAMVNTTGVQRGAPRPTNGLCWHAGTAYLAPPLLVGSGSDAPASAQRQAATIRVSGYLLPHPGDLRWRMEYAAVFGCAPGGRERVAYV